MYACQLQHIYVIVLSIDFGKFRDLQKRDLRRDVNTGREGAGKGHDLEAGSRLRW